MKNYICFGLSTVVFGWSILFLTVHEYQQNELITMFALGVIFTGLLFNAGLTKRDCTERDLKRTVKTKCEEISRLQVLNTNLATSHRELSKNKKCANKNLDLLQKLYDCGIIAEISWTLNSDFSIKIGDENKNVTYYVKYSNEILPALHSAVVKHYPESKYVKDYISFKH